MQIENPRISVVIPCYNIAGCVEACLESLAAQQHDSFEVVLIDDGSTDGTSALLDRRAAIDERFRVIHQKHKGPSSARNAGFAASQTPFVAFVDGDDVVSPACLAVLESMMDVADVACCGHKTIHPGKNPGFADVEGSLQRAREGCVVLDSKGALKAMANDQIQLAFWGKLFRRELLVKPVFPEGMIFEDLWSLGTVMSRAQRVAITDEPLYAYVARKDSITRSRPAARRAFQNLRAAMIRFEETYREALGLEHATDDPSYCLHLVHRLCGLHSVLEGSPWDDATKAAVGASLLEEIDAAHKLALLRGVSATHPQMLRAALLLKSPAAYNVAMRVWNGSDAVRAAVTTLLPKMP